MNRHTALRVAPALVLLLAVLAAGLVMFTGSDTKTLTAHFPRTVSLYAGNDVRILGVKVGSVDTVTPDGTDVVVTLHYDGDVDLPADVKAVMVAPSVVGDRYVQLTPAYTGGEVLADGVVLDVDRTAIPLELDDVYGNLDQLLLALGPQGANSDGTLGELLKTAAANLDGQGGKINQTIGDVATLAETLDDNSDQLFSSARSLNEFVGTLADNDQTVRDFNQSLGDVSGLLADERQELGTALASLSTALDDVARFVRTNKDALSTNIKGLNRVAKVLVKRRDELDETLKVAPLAIQNLALTYNPQAGTLDTNANLSMLPGQIASDPAMFLCSILASTPNSGQTCDLLSSVLPRGAWGSEGTGTSSGQVSDPTLGGLVDAGGGAR